MEECIVLAERLNVMGEGERKSESHYIPLTVLSSMTKYWVLP